MSQAKLDGCCEEKIALNPIESVDCSNVMTAIEMNKVSEANCSNEALIPCNTAAAATANLEAAPTTVVECNETSSANTNAIEAQ